MENENERPQAPRRVFSGISGRAAPAVRLKRTREILFSLMLGAGALSIPVVLGAVVVGGVAEEACTPATSAEVGTLGQLVLSDFEAGKTVAQIEVDVAESLFGSSEITPAVVAIVNNVLSLLLNIVEGGETSAADGGRSQPALVISPAALARMRAAVPLLAREMQANAPK